LKPDTQWAGQKGNSDMRDEVTPKVILKVSSFILTQHFLLI